MNAVAISVQVARVAAGSASEKGWVGKGAEGNAARRSAEGNKKKEKRGREAWHSTGLDVVFYYTTTSPHAFRMNIQYMTYPTPYTFIHDL